MRIPSGKTDQSVYFVAVDATDLKTRLTGLSSFTVYRSRNGAARVAYTSPTVTEIHATDMPGVYVLLVDQDTTIAAGSDSEEYCVHIAHAGMASVTRTIELYRRDIGAVKSQTDKLTFDGDNHVVADARKISTSAAAADNLEEGAEGLVRVTIGAGSTTTSVVTTLSEATNDHYNGRALTFLTGALAGQATSIEDYDGATKALTVVALTEAPAENDTAVIS